MEFISGQGSCRCLSHGRQIHSFVILIKYKKSVLPVFMFFSVKQRFSFKRASPVCVKKTEILYIIGSHKVINWWVYSLKALSNIDIWIKANKRQDFGNVIDNRHLLQWLLNIRIWWERESEGRIMFWVWMQNKCYTIQSLWCG